MKIKSVIAILLFIVLGALLLSQANFVAASSLNGGGSITPPITSPIKGYIITGRVAYKLVGWFKPAANVTIEALNPQTKAKITTLTKTDGTYRLAVPEASSSYKVRAFDSRDTIFAPLVALVSGPTTLNFQGILRLW